MSASAYTWHDTQQIVFNGFLQSVVLTFETFPRLVHAFLLTWLFVFGYNKLIYINTRGSVK